MADYDITIPTTGTSIGVVSSGSRVLDIFKYTNGGVVVGGIANKIKIVIPSGGTVIGGSSSNTFSNFIPISGGIKAGGSGSINRTRTISPSGGTRVAGHANAIADYHYTPVIDNTTVVLSSASITEASYKIAMSGEVFVELASAGVPTKYQFAFDVVFELSWRIKTIIDVTRIFRWNTGEIPYFFYRVQARCRQLTCPPVRPGDLSTSDSFNLCEYFYILNVQARSVGDLCQKLKARGFVFPILSVHRFTRPAFDADLPEGFDTSCNELEEVEICQIALCADFCIDYDVVEKFACKDKVFSYLSFNEVATPGLFPAVTGDAVVELDIFNNFSYLSTGELEIISDTFTLSSSYYYASDGAIVMDGESLVMSQVWHYTGGVYPFVYEYEPQIVEMAISDGSIWNNINNSIAEDGISSYALIPSSTTLTKNSSYLYFRDFVPVADDYVEGSRIVGVDILIKRKADSSLIKDNIVNLGYYDPDSGIYFPGVNLAKITGYPFIFTETTYILNESDVDSVDINALSVQYGVKLPSNNTFANGDVVKVDVDSVALNIRTASPEHQFVSLSGISGVKSSTWKYTSTGGGIELLNNNEPFMSISYRYIAVSQTFLVPLVDVLFVDPDLVDQLYPPSAIFNGVALVSKSSNYQSSGELIEITGIAASNPSDWNYVGVGESVSDGEALVKSSAYSYAFSELDFILVADNLISIDRSYFGSGDMDVSGDISISWRFMSLGIIEVEGEVLTTSPSYHYITPSDLLVYGEAEVDDHFEESEIVTIGFVDSVIDLQLIFGESDNVEIAIPDTTTNVSKCGCNLPLLLNLTHNIFNGNKLSQFLTRNNLSFNSDVVLNYNRINDSWQYNVLFDTPAESWSIVFEMKCTSDIGGESLPEKYWSIGLAAVQKLKTVNRDFATRILVVLPFSQICTNIRTDLSLRLDINPIFHSVAVDPDVSINQFVYFDEIGLFKGSYWNLHDIIFALYENKTSLDMSLVNLDSVLVQS